jgi:hypothetical protein
MIGSQDTEAGPRLQLYAGFPMFWARFDPMRNSILSRILDKSIAISARFLHRPSPEAT